jgi:hypothetical protein
MRASLTAVIEQANTYTGDFATEPYETAWASEARWFVNVLELEDGAHVSLHPEISPDGLTWCAEGSPSLEFDAPGLQSLPLTNFGPWLRLRATTTGTAKYLIYLSLKE